MPRKRATETPEDPNRKTVEMPDNPGQQTQEVDNASGTPEASEAPRPQDGQPDLKVRSEDDNRTGDVLNDERTEPLPSQFQEPVDKDEARRAREEERAGQMGGTQPSEPNIYAGTGEDVPRPPPPLPGEPDDPEADFEDEDDGDPDNEDEDTVGGEENIRAGDGGKAKSRAEFQAEGLEAASPDARRASGDPRGAGQARKETAEEPDDEPVAREGEVAPGELPPDPRSELDKSLELGPRARVPMPGQPGVETEVIKGPASRDPFLDTADQAEGDDRTLAGLATAEDTRNESDPEAAKQTQDDRADLTIFNTRIGGEPGREMRDTTRESADKDTATTGYSGSPPEPGVARKTHTVKVSDVRRLSGGPQPVDLNKKPIRHAELAERLLREGYKMLREGGRGDDAHYLKNAMHFALRLQPKLHAKMTGRR